MNPKNEPLISRKKAYDALMFQADMRSMSYTHEAYKGAARLIDQMDGEKPQPDERIKQIADYYGPVQQKEQLIEECSELILASQKCKRDGTRAAFDNFCEEVADVYIMVQQMMYLISPDVIGEIVERKLNRQIERIKDESEPETAELPEVNTEGMQSGEIRTERNGDAWKSVKKI